jgi:hypothetical protein
MRHRKVISLYEADPSHAELLEYLEGIEGRNRQAQALLQMLMIGARVVLRQESGEQAWFAARNPDVRTVRREAKARQQPIPVAEVPALSSTPIPAPAPQAPASLPAPPLRVEHPPAVEPEPITPKEPAEGFVELAGTYEPLPPSHQDNAAYPDEDDDDDFMDPLQRLQMMREE